MLYLVIRLANHGRILCRNYNIIERYASIPHEKNKSFMYSTGMYCCNNATQPSTGILKLTQHECNDPKEQEREKKIKCTNMICGELFNGHHTAQHSSSEEKLSGTLFSNRLRTNHPVDIFGAKMTSYRRRRAR